MNSPRMWTRSEFVPIPFLLAFALSSLDADLLIVFLQRGQILPGLGELPLLHSFANIPMHKGTLRVHKIELVVDAGEDLGDGRRVADHAASTHHFGQVTAGNDSGRLVVDATLKSRRTPIHELNGA